mgnify:CR=1 FL=1
MGANALTRLVPTRHSRTLEAPFFARVGIKGRRQLHLVAGGLIEPRGGLLPILLKVLGRVLNRGLHFFGRVLNRGLHFLQLFQFDRSIDLNDEQVAWKRMATETVYIVQAYVQSRGKALSAEPQVGCKDAEEARRKAERLAPLRLGVVAFAVSADTETISAAALWLRSASLRTSDATTAKPLPCSPARAASTAAFRARRSVWRQRKAGIWRTSTASAATSHWAGSCTSVSTGRPRSSSSRGAAARLRHARPELVRLHQHGHEGRDVVDARASREVVQGVGPRVPSAQFEVDET